MWKLKGGIWENNALKADFSCEIMNSGNAFWKDLHAI